MRAIAPAYAANLRGEQCRLAATCGRALVEPVPAAPRVRTRRLLRQQDEAIVAIRERRDARAVRHVLGRLPAAVHEHDECPPPPAAPAAGYVDQVITARPDPRRDAD